jgi:hypothetical protein
MDEQEDLQGRLRAMGEHPVDPSLQSAHLTAMARVSPRRSFGPKLRAAGIFLTGLLVGGSGLAAAGALPDPAQHAAHRALGVVGVDVPDPERYHGPECGAEERNHGGYVRDDHALAGTDCGKPVQAGTGGDDTPGAERGQGAGPKDGCQGPPPWAGPDKPSMTPEERAAAQAERLATCGAEAGDSEPDATEPRETATTTTSTTAPPATTTTTAATTTTTESTTTTTEATTTGG